METRDFSTTILTDQTPEEAYQAINNVRGWWSEEIEGGTEKLNDIFLYHYKDVHMSKMKLIEVIPDKKIVWLVTESKLNWLQNDMEEWTNTKMIFEIIAKGDKTVLCFTHEGLIPEKECYEKCEQGWNMVIKDWLFNFITTGAIKIYLHHIKMKEN